MTQTTKSNLINAEVFADAVTAKLGDAIKLYPLAYVENFENEQAGSITVPKYEYIGDAEVVAEGVAIDPSLLSQTSENLAIVKVGKAVDITDEAVKGGLGNPIGQAEDQLVKSIASGIEKKMFEALEDATLVYDASATGKVDAETYFKSVELFGEDQDGEKYLLVNPNQTANVKGNKDYFIDGMFVDATVIISNRVPVDEAYIVKPEAVALYIAKDVQVETDRDILKKSTVISADEHFATHLRDQSKVVKIKLA